MASENHHDNLELKSSEERYRLISQMTSDYVFSTNVMPDGTLDLDWIAGAFEAMTGYGVEEYKAMGGWRAALHPDDIAIDERDFLNLQSNQTVSSEVRTFKKNGEVVWVQVYAQPVIDKHTRRLSRIYGAVQNITERKKMEQSLQESEEKYRLLVENSKEAVCVAQDGMLRFMNKRTIEVFGYSYEEITARPFTFFIHPDDLPVVLERYTDQIAGNPVETSYTFRILPKQGPEKWVRSSSVSIEWDSRPAVLVFLSDVNEQMNAELLLLRQHEQITQLVESMTDAFVSLDKSWRYTYMNRRAGEIFGRDPQKMIGKHIWTEFPEEVSQPFHLNYEKAMRDQVSIQIEEYYPPYDKWFENRIYPTKEGLAIFFQDITVRKKAELAMVKANNMLQAVLDASSDAITLTDSSGKFFACNEVLMNRWGKTRGEILGMSAAEVLPPEIYRSRLQQVQECIRLGKGTTFTDSYGGKWFENNMEPVIETDGTILSVAMFSRDITERKKAEEEILQLNLMLERRVEERTNELAAANRDLEAFGYSVSHDLRAPLRHIDGFSRLLRKQLQATDPESERYFSKIFESVAKMSGMIDALLKFSRLGRKPIVKREVDLNTLVRKVVDTFRNEPGYRESEIIIGELPVVQGDSELLQLVFENLISNAVKFSSKVEKPRVEIGQTTENNKVHHIFVKDNGAGFDMEYAHNLFNVFQRLHTPEEFEGTGIGLASVRQIVQKHGGSIRAEARVNEGATFFITL